MSSEYQTPLAAIADKLITLLPPPLDTYASNIITNITGTFTRLTPQQYIRLIIFVGAYALLRPYLLKLGAGFQTRDHERPLDISELEVKNAKGEVVGVPEDSDSDSEEEGARAVASGAGWGKKAKRRQRRMLRKIMEEKEKREMETQEEIEDKDIEEFLVE
ncbi:MAG: hypothetical protein MMC33_008132 [Icmadophila ericetorum]|nr:hypothetical protein [Icmadophila ericetorum]